MFRSGASRALLRSLTTSTSSSAFRSQQQHQLRSQLCTLSRTSPLSPTKPLGSKTLALVRYASRTGDRSAMDEINAQHETAVAKEKLEAHPESVSSTSSMHPLNSELGGIERTGKKEEDEDTDMFAGVRGDLVRCASRSVLYKLRPIVTALQ